VSAPTSSSPPPGNHAAEVASLLAAEDAGWTELRTLVNSLSPDQFSQTGYYEEGWSAKDLVAHIGSWLAEAGVILERIRGGTYRPDEIDVDALNQQFLEAMRDVPPEIVIAQCTAARTRMRQSLAGLPEVTPDAAFWIGKAGPEHYGEHLPRLKSWVEEVASSRSRTQG
jgi:hypothetical protein